VLLESRVLPFSEWLTFRWVLSLPAEPPVDAELLLSAALADLLMRPFDPACEFASAGATLSASAAVPAKIIVRMSPPSMLCGPTGTAEANRNASGLEATGVLDHPIGS
jgi:hypothetical protein